MIWYETVHTHRASFHQAAKLVAALLRVAGVTAGLAESNGSLPPGLWHTSPAGWLPRTEISSGTLRSVSEYRLPLPFYVCIAVYVSVFSTVASWWSFRCRYSAGMLRTAASQLNGPTNHRLTWPVAKPNSCTIVIYVCMLRREAVVLNR